MLGRGYLTAAGAWRKQANNVEAALADFQDIVFLPQERKNLESHMDDHSCPYKISG